MKHSFTAVSQCTEKESEHICRLLFDKKVISSFFCLFELITNALVWKSHKPVSPGRAESAISF